MWSTIERIELDKHNLIKVWGINGELMWYHRDKDGLMHPGQPYIATMSNGTYSVQMFLPLVAGMPALPEILEVIDHTKERP